MLNPYLFKMKPYPLRMLVDIHAFCNARCGMCPYPKYAKTQSQGHMTWDAYAKIIDEFSEMGRQYNFTPELSYCYMGEVFLANHVEKYVQHATDQNIKVYLNTNAHVMTPEKIDALLATGFNGDFYISSHTHNPKTYKRIMGLEYQQTLDNILYLLAHYDPSKVLIRGVDDRWEPGDKETWFDFWEPKGVKIEYLEPISRCGSVKRLLPSNLKTQIKEEKPVRLYGCQNNLPLYEMIVLYDGRAVMCCQDMGREHVFGNVITEGVATVWNGDNRVNTVKRLYNGSKNSASFLCSKCEYALTASELVTSVFSKAIGKLKPSASAVTCEV